MKETNERLMGGVDYFYNPQENGGGGGNGGGKGNTDDSKTKEENTKNCPTCPKDSDNWLSNA